MGDTKVSLTVSLEMLLLGPSLRRKRGDALTSRADLHPINQWSLAPFQSQQKSPIWGGIKEKTLLVFNASSSTVIQQDCEYSKAVRAAQWCYSSIMKQRGCGTAWLWGGPGRRPLLGYRALLCSTGSCLFCLSLIRWATCGVSVSARAHSLLSKVLSPVRGELNYTGRSPQASS